ncbi:MAG TPA: hypothetical protein DEG55_00700 [Acidaminococcaceae bacterium]|nr:hypothetical protein [Acidaminococcaceae bacterium]
MTKLWHMAGNRPKPAYSIKYKKRNRSSLLIGSGYISLQYVRETWIYSSARRPALFVTDCIRVFRSSYKCI